MPNTLQTILHAYRFNTRNDTERAEYYELCSKLEGMGLHCFATIDNPSDDTHRKYNAEIEAADGKPFNLEMNCLFDNQWNGERLRVFDWAESIYPNRDIKSGYWLEQTAEMREVRRNTHKCGYCGKQEPAAKGYVFCPHCVGNAYLKPSDLHLLRMVSINDTNKPRAPLTNAEREHLLPIYREAQLHGNSERDKKRLRQTRERILTDYNQTVSDAKEKRDGALWIMDNIPGMLENWIYYPHQARHCFGWRKPLDSELLEELLEKINEFPFCYDIKCEDGRTLSGEH